MIKKKAFGLNNGGRIIGSIDEKNVSSSQTISCAMSIDVWTPSQLGKFKTHCKCWGSVPINDSGKSMFYNKPYKQFIYAKVDDIRIHSFLKRKRTVAIHKQSHLSRYWQDTGEHFGKKYMSERQIKIPVLQELYKKTNLSAF